MRSAAASRRSLRPKQTALQVRARYVLVVSGGEGLSRGDRPSDRGLTCLGGSCCWQRPPADLDSWPPRSSVPAPIQTSFRRGPSIDRLCRPRSGPPSPRTSRTARTASQLERARTLSRPAKAKLTQIHGMPAGRISSMPRRMARSVARTEAPGSVATATDALELLPLPFRAPSSGSNGERP
jgi:hypothetical protein